MCWNFSVKAVTLSTTGDGIVFVVVADLFYLDQRARACSKHKLEIEFVKR